MAPACVSPRAIMSTTMASFVLFQSTHRAHKCFTLQDITRINLINLITIITIH